MPAAVLLQVEYTSTDGAPCAVLLRDPTIVPARGRVYHSGIDCVRQVRAVIDSELITAFRQIKAPATLPPRYRRKGTHPKPKRRRSPWDPERPPGAPLPEPWESLWRAD